MRIALIGPRGAGKSAVAQLLAARLDLPCLDTDALVTALSGRTIPELFAAGTFRQREREVVADALSIERGVVALGGGAVLDPDFDAPGWTLVLLTAAPAVLAQRIASDPTERPSLTGRPAHEEIADVVSSRQERYDDLAHFRIATDTLDVGGVVDSILTRLR